MKTRQLMMLAAVAVLAAGLVIFSGCKKKERPVAPPKAAATAAAAEIEQTMCPIMDGNKIDKNVFVEYKGKKVYFCCTVCKAKFEVDPEKYIAKLPQFAQ